VKPDAPFELYNLQNDIGESNNLATQHPALVKQLATLMDAAVR